MRFSTNLLAKYRGSLVPNLFFLRTMGNQPSNYECVRAEYEILHLMRIPSHDTSPFVVNQVQRLSSCGETYQELINKYKEEYHGYRQRYTYLPSWEELPEAKDSNAMQAKTNMANKFRSETVELVHNSKLLLQLQHEERRVREIERFFQCKRNF